MQQINKYIAIVIFSTSFVVFEQNSSLQAQFNKNLTTEQRKEYNLQIQQSSQKIRENPNDYHYYLQRGVAYSNLGLHPDAISDYNKVIKIAPNVPEAYYNRGISRARFRFTKLSCQDVKKAADLGLEQAKNLYKQKCGMYFGELGKIE